MQQSQIQTLRDAYWTGRSELEQAFLRHLDADRFLLSHTEQVDLLMHKLTAESLEKAEFAVIATAGYGRREQFPGSDVDLLIVHDLPQGGEVESVLSPFLHALWDLRFKVGQQVWSVNELRTLMPEDYQFILALFDARLVAGSARLAQLVSETILPAFLDSNRAAMVEKVVCATRERHQKFNNTIYQLEPDVKEAPGGLRDLHAAAWLQRLTGDSTFVPFSPSEIELAHAFQKKVRILLHLKAGRSDDRLTHPMQEKLKNYFGFRRSGTRSGVESLMKEYFLNARVVSGVCKAAFKSLDTDKQEHSLRLDHFEDLDTAAGVLGAVLESMRVRRPLADEVRNHIVKSLPKISTSLDFPALRDKIKEIFHPQPGLYRALSEMYELGLLELLFPEFGTVKAMMIRDFYHKYTVDEHTLIAIKSVEDLVTGDTSADGRFAAILEDTVVPCHVTLGLLFHDVGKGRGGKHADQSARLAARALRRYRFGREEINRITAVIRNHLAMSATIFRRDLEDEEVIRRFSNLVADPENLRLLTLLTYADIKAVAPGTLNDWKKELLWQLYLSAYRKLTLEFGEERIEEDVDMGDLLLKGLDSGIDREAFEDFLEGFPTRYLRSTPSEEIYEHFRMSTRVSPEAPVQTQLLNRKSHFELCVITPDRSRLFAKIVGLLSYFEMNILRGYGFANKGQTILDFFQFIDPNRTFRHSVERERFQDLLTKAVKDDVSVQDLLKGKERSVLFQRTAPTFEPNVYFEDDETGRYTIVEIIAPDAIGLLYRISSEISRLGCEIDLALISTEGEKAVDVFYLRHHGSELGADLKSELSQRIVEVTK